MATTHMPVQEQDFYGPPDGATNNHIRKQIQRLRLSKGWTKHDLEQAAGMAADTLEDFEAGIRRLNVDTLRKIIEALESDITEVWPSCEQVHDVNNSLPVEQAGDPLQFSRLAEIHSLTCAEASCMFIGENVPDPASTNGENSSQSVLRTLSAINLNSEDRDRLRRKVLRGSATNPWVTYLHHENGRSLYLCLKNPQLQFGSERLIKRCLSTWLSATTS